MTRSHSVIDSPIGPLTVVVDDGAVTGIYMAEHRHAPGETAYGDRVGDAHPALTEQLAAYFAGDLTEFDVPTSAPGTPFQQQVWAALRHIPYGETWSYARLATEIGNPAAVRAVGLANGRNPISIVVPCHRVVGANGSLTGYGGGIERKRFLLDLEARQSTLA